MIVARIFAPEIFAILFSGYAILTLQPNTHQESGDAKGSGPMLRPQPIDDSTRCEIQPFTGKMLLYLNCRDCGIFSSFLWGFKFVYMS